MAKIKYLLLQKFLTLFISNADLTPNDDKIMFAALRIIKNNDITDRD